MNAETADKFSIGSETNFVSLAKLSMRFKRFIILLFVVIAIGCSSSNLTTHPVRGQLEFPDGTFPKFGTVEFYNAEHRVNARGEINPDGSFTVETYAPKDGAVAGRHAGVILQFMSNPLSAKREVVIEVDGETAHDHDHDHDQADMVHLKYADYRTSELSIQVEPGNNQVTLEIQKQ